MYTRQFLGLAETMKTDACFGYDRDTMTYLVYLKDVFFKKADELDSPMHYPIKGNGTTIEDACHQFLYKARGKHLYHIFTDLTEFVI
jgi:hypothetical protein